MEVDQHCTCCGEMSAYGAMLQAGIDSIEVPLGDSEAAHILELCEGPSRSSLDVQQERDMQVLSRLLAPLHVTCHEIRKKHLTSKCVFVTKSV